MSIANLLKQGFQEKAGAEPAIMKVAGMDALIFGYPVIVAGKHFEVEDAFELEGKWGRDSMWKTLQFLSQLQPDPQLYLYPMKIDGKIYLPVQNTTIQPYNVDKIIERIRYKEVALAVSEDYKLSHDALVKVKEKYAKQTSKQTR